MDEALRRFRQHSLTMVIVSFLLVRRNQIVDCVSSFVVDGRVFYGSSAFLGVLLRVAVGYGKNNNEIKIVVLKTRLSYIFTNVAVCTSKVMKLSFIFRIYPPP